MPNILTADRAVLEILGLHVAEWRGDKTVGYPRWFCTCATWRGDHYPDWHVHLTEMLEPRIRERALVLLEDVADAIETERDNKDRVWHEPGRGWARFQAGMSAAIYAIREAVKEKR